MLKYCNIRYPIHLIQLEVLYFKLELLFGIAWQDMMISELLEPLGMQNTTFYDREAPDYEGFATPYIWDTLNGNPEELVPFPHELNRYEYELRTKIYKFSI